MSELPNETEPEVCPVCEQPVWAEDVPSFSLVEWVPKHDGEMGLSIAGGNVLVQMFCSLAHLQVWAAFNIPDPYEDSENGRTD